MIVHELLDSAANGQIGARHESLDEVAAWGRQRDRKMYREEKRSMDAPMVHGLLDSTANGQIGAGHEGLSEVGLGMPDGQGGRQALGQVGGDGRGQRAAGAMRVVRLHLLQLDHLNLLAVIQHVHCYLPACSQ